MVVTQVNVALEPRAHPNGKPGRSTGVFKAAVDALEAGRLGAAGDHVCDTRYHGGPSKALCVYCADHYAEWARRHPEVDWRPGAFGENLSVSGLDEATTRIGDVYEVGTAVVQVSQPRGPCGTLAARFGLPGFVDACVKAGWTGWYLRVLRPGALRAGDPLRLITEHPAGLTVADANAIRYAKPPLRGDLERVLAVDALSDAWRSDLAELWRRAGG